MAGHGRMGASQREFRVARVVKVRGLPPGGLVAGLALAAHATGVGVRSCMTAHAFARQLVVEPAAAMTGLAGRLLVRSHQRKPGFLLMVELRICPRCLRMAIGTGRTALPAMHVVRGMAAGAPGGRPLPVVGGMAGGAGNLRVACLQRESGGPGRTARSGTDPGLPHSAERRTGGSGARRAARWSAASSRQGDPRPQSGK